MFRIPPHILMASGLLLISLAVGLRAIGPASLHSDLGDGLIGLALGVGLGLELAALYKMRKAKGG